MKLHTILPLFASLLAATAAASSVPEQTGRTEGAALQGDLPPAKASPDHTTAGSADPSPWTQEPGEGVHEALAASGGSDGDYNYSSAFERLAKGTTRDSVSPTPPAQEEKQVSPEPDVPQPPVNENADELAEDDEIELDGDAELPPLHTYLQREHYEALGDFVKSMRSRFDREVHNNISEESRYIAAKVKAPRSSIGRALDKVLANEHTGYFKPVAAKRLQQLHLLGFADEELHNRRAHLADAHGLPYVPKRWATPSSSEEVLKLKRGPLINHGFASATYAVRRIFPYNKDPGRADAPKEGALKAYIVKRKTISENLAEEIVRHQCGVWKALPPERAEELAEHGHLLYPVAVLKMVEDKTAAGTSGRRKSGAALDSDSGGSLSELLNNQILNLFLLYPRAYECTLKFFIVSSGRTDLLIKIAPMKVMMSISIQMIYAVAQLNSYGLVHSRIRPNSFVITSDGKVLLTDFFSTVPTGTKLSCFQQAVPMALDVNSSPEEAECTDRVPGHEYEATMALDSWRLGVTLYKLWCRESWDPSTDPQKWEQELERRRRVYQARSADPYKHVQRYNRHELTLQHCRKDTPSFILRLIQQFLEPVPAARLTAIDAVRGTSLFIHMKRRIQQAQAILENLQRQRRREEL